MSSPARALLRSGALADASLCPPRSRLQVALATLASIVGWLPFGALARWGAAVGWLAGSVLRVRRAHVEGAMRRAGIADAHLQARAMYGALGAAALELLWVSAASASSVKATFDTAVRMDDASRARWDAACARGRGVVVAASHTGNWDLAACAMAAELELLVVTKRLTVQGVDAFWQGTRAASGVTLCEADGALARGRATLARRGAVAMMIDQVPLSSAHAVLVEFLGAPAHVDRAPATLAARTGAPLVVTAARRTEDGTHVIDVLDVLEPPPRADRTWIDGATRAATRALERYVLSRPSQWLWLHRRWRLAPARRRASRARRGASAST